MKLLPCTSAGPPRTILVILPTWVGDFVMATPFLRAVRRRFPDARITFLAETNLSDLVRGGPWMDDVLFWPARAHRRPWRRAYRDCIKALRRRSFDQAILLPNSFAAALTAWLSGARRRIGYNRDGRGLLLTDRMPVANRRTAGHPRTRNEAASHSPAAIPDRSRGRYRPMPLVDYYADLAEAIGCERPDDRLELFATAEDDASLAAKLAARGVPEHGPLVVIGPGAKFGAAKCWFPQRYAAVADRMIREWDATVIVTCGPGEEPIARAIRGAMRERAFVFDEPRLTLGELKSLAARADLLLCNDAGLRHFARAFDLPVVTVFGPTHPEWTRTSYGKERIVRIDVECGPCQQPVCPLGHLQCMEGVTVDAVFDAAEELLAGAGPLASRPAALAASAHVGPPPPRAGLSQIHTGGRP